MTEAVKAKPEKNSPAGRQGKANPLVYVGIGCVVLVILFGLGSAIIGRFFAKKIGTGLVEKAIEANTGVKTNIEDLETGKMSFTDEKTGTKVDIGTNTIPVTFPKDFPLYPDAKVTSSLSGAQAGKDNGFWLTMSTSDTTDAVINFYKVELTKNGWMVESTFTANAMTSQTVKKNTMNGSLSIGKSSDDNTTEIVIILGEENK